MTCRAIANRTFISVELLLSLVTIDPKNLNLSTRPIALPAIVITWSASLSASITIMCVFVALIVSPKCALMFSIAETCCCNLLHDLAIRVVSSAYLKFQTDLPPHHMFSSHTNPSYNIICSHSISSYTMFPFLLHTIQCTLCPVIPTLHLNQNM